MSLDFLVFLLVWWLPGAIGSLCTCILIRCEPGLCKEPLFETIMWYALFVVVFPVFLGPVCLVVALHRLFEHIWYRGLNK